MPITVSRHGRRATSERQQCGGEQLPGEHLRIAECAHHLHQPVLGLGIGAVGDRLMQMVLDLRAQTARKPRVEAQFARNCVTEISYEFARVHGFSLQTSRR
jgi:hypothetical protein